MTDDVDENVREACRTMFDRARAVDDDPGEQPPRLFEHALRLLISSDHIELTEETSKNDA
ncbi:hypothetical protein [Natrinema soli]|uniref:Uncharacterized protein n=1 Tax=Natrinema soli TaxID=1930624 RepID=A0ABD5SP19_9EURY|nr:hypothetical protein [Natrinema soli]